MRVRTGGTSEARATIAVDAVLGGFDALGVLDVIPAENPGPLAGAAD